MNALIADWNLLSWKPLVTALLLPPVPMLALLLWAWLWRDRRPTGAGALMLLSLCGLWLSQCDAVGWWMEDHLLPATPPLVGERLAQLQRQAGGGKVAVVVLGGGRETEVPEYAGAPDLGLQSMKRLQLGQWLARQLGPAPVLYAGGLGHGDTGLSEAEAAQAVTLRDQSPRLRWLDTRSRDTRENARNAVALLRNEGVRHLVLVTHGWHMPRAMRAFSEAQAQTGSSAHLVAAPMGLYRPPAHTWQHWVPSADGHRRFNQVMKEWLGWRFGA